MCPSSDQLQLQEKWPHGFWRHRSLKAWMSRTLRMEQAWQGCRQGSYRQRCPCCIAPPHEVPVRNPVSLELSILTQMRSVPVGSSRGLVELTCSSGLSQGPQVSVARLSMVALPGGQREALQLGRRLLDEGHPQLLPSAGL